MYVHVHHKYLFMWILNSVLWRPFDGGFDNFTKTLFLNGFSAQGYFQGEMGYIFTLFRNDTEHKSMIASQ